MQQQGSVTRGRTQVHRKEQKDGRSAERRPMHRLLAALLMLHLPALVAFGLARDLSTPGWVAIYLMAVLAECAVLFVLWRALGRATGQVENLASDLGQAERERTQLVAEKRQVTGELLVSLARRNQSLLHRQLAKIDEMEAREQDP